MQAIIKNVYNDPAGFGSMKQTFQDAKKKDNTVTMQDVQTFFKAHVEQKKQLRGTNTLVAPHAKWEYEMDLFFINDIANQKFKIGMILIDVFSRFMQVVPLAGKDEANLLAGLMEGINKMHGKPEQIYSDDEGALQTSGVKEYFEEAKIKHIVTRSHANHAERAIRTFKDMLYKRVDASHESNVQWTNFIFQILLTYNSKNKHSTTGMTPSDAHKESNRLETWNNTFVKAKHTRKYPVIHKNDSVKVLRKKKAGEKERTSVWSNDVYSVEDMIQSHGQMFYKLSNGKQHLRHELLKM